MPLDLTFLVNRAIMSGNMDVFELMNVSLDGMLICDDKGVVRAVNASYYDMVEDYSPLMRKNINSLPDSLYRILSESLDLGKSNRGIIALSSNKELSVSCAVVNDKKGKTYGVLTVSDNSAGRGSLKEKRSDEPPKGDFMQLYKSPVMKRIIKNLEGIADYDVTIMLRGESGVGKTTLAKYIHNIGNRGKTGEFVHISCTSIPESLLESELFGYEAGAFTSANKRKAGLFERADKGTILLDEIGDMSLHLQAKLLNVLQEKKYYRIGGTEPVTTDARVIAATNANLEVLVSEGRFREDLLYRLNVIPVEIPRLADRPEDIPVLAQAILEQLNTKYNKRKYFSPETIKYLADYEWPGNIRELVNTIERIVVLSMGDELDYIEFMLLDMSNKSYDPPEERTVTSTGAENLWMPGVTLKQAVAAFESKVIKEALSMFKTVKRTAAELGVDEKTLRRKRKK